MAKTCRLKKTFKQKKKSFFFFFFWKSDCLQHVEDYDAVKGLLSLLRKKGGEWLGGRGAANLDLRVGFSAGGRGVLAPGFPLTQK